MKYIKTASIIKALHFTELLGGEKKTIVAKYQFPVFLLVFVCVLIVCVWGGGGDLKTIVHNGKSEIMIIIIIDCFYIVLFFALDQSHCAHVTRCMWFWMSDVILL